MRVAALLKPFYRAAARNPVELIAQARRLC